MKRLIFLLLTFQSLAVAQAVDKPKILIDTNGNFTNIHVEGSLASTQNIGCIRLSESKNTFSPPDLYKGVSECVSQDKYDLAARLFALAGIYGAFDAERVSDKTAGQAKSILILNTMSNYSSDQKSKFQEAINNISKNEENLRELCGEVRAVGMPNYYPNYMILHGINALTGNSNGEALIKDFDAPKTWNSLQIKYLNCSN